ncbi:hypothetical protein PR003_g16614 [Phytophthora rubi]|uniref:Uncharacterized protein n=1 Tax=Phytophthora rubi TaxID=129364 RepID=A0A6A4EF22_9STRA|nr:hypothetical protein PR003_g16614 [Phytophthora rubi]
MEQLALAAVTVNVWALEAGSTALIVGDVIANGVGETPAPRLYVSPRHTPHPIHGGRQKRRYGGPECTSTTHTWGSPYTPRRRTWSWHWDAPGIFVELSNSGGLDVGWTWTPHH